ncbi:SseB protein N-terminal domain-containing protein [Ruminococcaceae bacterium YRB3002]|nr:SseB protein N-terminal domain-containing protein [Ruminococcaceae bacterium YRB3002]
MAFWNKKKQDNDEEEKLNGQAAGVADTAADDMDEAMRAITEAMDEERAEQAEKAKERAQESERILKEMEEARERALKTASEYLSESSGDEKSDGRKFYMMVEGPSDYAPKGEKNIMVEGNCYGKINKGDEVFIYKPDYTVITMKVEDIRTGPNLFAETAENKHLVIELSGENKEELPRFSVITDSVPDMMEQKHQQITNPLILGLSFEFNLYAADKEFFSVLVGAIVHGQYVTHAKLDPSSISKGKGKVSIMSIRDDSEQDGLLIPVFTDVYNMSRARAKFKPEEVTVLPLSFPQLAEVSTTQKHTGFVINPFGPVSIKIPAHLINDIRRMESYKKEFAGADTGISVNAGAPGVPAGVAAAAAGAPKAVRIEIMVPPETPEYKALRGALLKQCQADPNIRRAGIVIRKEQGRRGTHYLCIVDCPENVEKETFTKLFIAMKPLTGNHQIVFERYDTVVFADDYFSKQKLIYEKK